MISLHGVTKVYGEATAVNDLDLVIQDGEVCVLIGPSGCGKSTTLKMINRMEEQTTGTILVNGEDNTVQRPEFLRRSIGYVIQSIGLFPHMNVRNNIGVVPKLLKWEKAQIESRVTELIELIGLDPDQYGAKYPHELSGGEAQRIGVARALAADPPILLMDEPFGAVDPLGRLVLQNEFLSIQRKLKKTVVFVTHDLDEAIRLADRIAIMKDGKIIQYDEPETILTTPADSFVRDFVGSDRSLKKLARFEASQVMNPPLAVDIGHESVTTMLDDLKGRGCTFVWAVDNNMGLRGWIDLKHPLFASDPMSGYSEVSVADMAVEPDYSLKSVLSRMLGEGVKNVPVVDHSGTLIGEISLQDIERITET